MWHVKYDGPFDNDTPGCLDSRWPTWREAHSTVIVQIKTVAPKGTYATLITEASHAKAGQNWSTTDGVHRFSLALPDTELDAETVMTLLLDEPLPSVDMQVEAAALCAALDEAFPESEAVKPPATTDDYIDHTAREHSELGASIAERWMNCPASVRLVLGQPNPTSPAAERGTAAHEVAHMCLTSGQDAIEYVGRTVNAIEIDDVIADGVQAYLDNCRSHVVTESHFEVRFNLESLGPPAPMYGTADYVGYDEATQTVYVDDYKNGFMYVDPRTPQLRYYALGAMLALGNDKPVSQIIVTICQPNALGTTLKTDTFDAVDLVEWSQELIAAAHRTQDPDAPAKAGSWCDKTFCPVRGSCAARAMQSLAAAQVEFADLMSPMKTPEVRLMTPAELGAVHGAASGLIAFLEAVSERIKQDTAGTGWKLVPTNPQEAWRDEDEAAMTLQMDHGIADPYTREVISPAVARGKIAASLHTERVAQHATGKKPTKKAAEADARALLADLLTKRSGGTKLVPEADPRPAVPTNGA